ncbi:MAG: hypothetical protein IJ353_08675 [Lachnospiraceae bacterium]|nr:hypothetical protein [Lachnospiraceae bacterium]
MRKEKKTKFLFVGAAVLVGTLLFCSGMQVGAATNEPGSAGDPLITLSYLEQRLEQSSSSYECITLKKGEHLSLIQGSQIILYTGTASVLENLIDTTAGALVTGGKKAEKYHAYLAPADGSGFTAETTCVIFLSGETQ